MTYAYIKKLDEGRVNVTVLEEPHDKKMWHGDRTILTPTPSREFSEDNLLTEEDLTNGYYYIEIDEDNCLVEPDLSQLRLGWCLWIVLVLVRAFWVCRVGH